MGILSTLYTELLWRPLFNGLVLLYDIVPYHDLGLAIIVLTIIIRAILAPLLWKGQKTQRDMMKVQPEIKRIQAKFKDDREGQGKALMELYAQHKVNPFSGCLVMLAQIPILIALLYVFQDGFDAAQLSYLYSFVPHPGAINPISFGGLDLSKGNLYLGVIAAVLQYFQTKLTMPAQPSEDQNSFTRAMSVQTLYVFPLLILLWSRVFPSALTIYWTVMSLFAIVQELVMRKLAAKKIK